MKRTALALACLLAVASGVEGQTRTTDRVRLQISRDGQTIKFVVDDSRQEFVALAGGHTFLATRPLTITAWHFNPLTHAITVTVNDASDPTHATLGQLVESLLGIAKTLGATIPGAAANNAAINALARGGTPAAGCTARAEAASMMDGLNTAFGDKRWEASAIKKKIDGAATAINTAFAVRSPYGPDAMSAGAKVIDDFVGTSDDAELRGVLKGAQEQIKALDEIMKDLNAVCDEGAKATYATISLSDPHGRAERLAAIVEGLAGISKSLKTYGEPANWSTQALDEYKLKDSIDATAETMKKVKVAIVVLEYKNTDGSAVLTPDKKEGASREFTVQRYQSWVPEIGAGLTFSWVKHDRFGTGKNAAGETVIARTKDSGDPVKVDPTLMVNFVCGFCRATAVSPMFQVGTATSKTDPAIFAGAGIRLKATKKGDFALGGGFVIPFAKGLKPGVKVDDVIAGTAELEENLEWQRVKGRHPYLTLQYKF